MRPDSGLILLVRAAGPWVGLTLAIGLPVLAAATSPLLQWRDPVYILAAFVGVVALALLLLQPLLIAGALPGLQGMAARRIHRWIGGGIVVSVVIHVGGLWITSPPDVVDALLFRSPTAFSLWGVVAMWAVFASGVLAIFRRRLRWRTWRNAHVALSVVIVAGTIAHAIPIEGTMDPVTKAVLCVLTAVATLAAVTRLPAGSRA